MSLFADHGGDGHDLFDGVGGGIRVPTNAICEEWEIQAMAGMPQAMISVVCPRGWVAMDVQPVAVTTVAPVSAPARTGQMALRS